VHRILCCGAACLLALLLTVRAEAQGRTVAGETELDGTLEVQYEDFDGGARLRHWLNTPTERIELTFPGKPPEILAGNRVRAKGQLTNGALALSSEAAIVTLGLPIAPNTFGVQRTVVILINFTNDASQPYTVETARTVAFTETNAFYQGNTYQQTSLSGDVVGWYTLPASNTTCDTNTWAGLADQAATSYGVNVGSYARKIYAFPQTNACNWWGLGSVGGNPSRAWINGEFAMRVLGHELGHNFGSYHSHSQPCDATGCTIVEYGDDRDIMGGSTGHMTAAQKERLGWLNYGASPTIQTVTTAGNYWIESLERSGSGPKALKILKSTNSSGYRTWYYVETRGGTVSGPKAGAGAAGVIIHTADEANANSSYQKDLQPSNTTWLSTLGAGQTFADASLGLTITTVSTDASGAIVDVTIGATPPTVTPAPTNLVATPWNQSVSLTWTTVAGATYDILRSTVAGGPYAVVAVGVQVSSYTDGALTNGVTYYYVVQARTDAGQSTNSNQANATPTAPNVCGPKGCPSTPGGGK